MSECVLAGSQINGKTKIQYDSMIARATTHCMDLVLECMKFDSKNFVFVEMSSGVDCLYVRYRCGIDGKDYMKHNKQISNNN